MVQIYGILLALVAGLVACNALTCWTCLDDECIDGKLFVLCSRTKVQESHDHISAIYGQVPTNPPLIIRNYDCVEMDTLLVYRNNSERYSSYKGCLERGSSILNISHNAAVYYNETRKYLSSCTDDFCNSKEIFRPFPNITTPSVNNTTPTVNVTTPSINITTPSLNITTPSINITTPSLNITTPSLNITTPSINITTPSIKTTSSTTTVAPPALKCYMCADDQCSKKTENSCSRENVDSTHKKLSDHFNQKSETKDKIESFQCMSIYSDIGDKKLLHKGCVEDGFDPCGLKDPKEKRDHCYACTKDLCNSASTLGAGLMLLAVAAISLFH